MELPIHPVILAGEPGCGGTRLALPAPMGLILLDDVVELAEGALLLDLLAEARR